MSTGFRVDFAAASDVTADARRHLPIAVGDGFCTLTIINARRPR